MASDILIKAARENGKKGGRPKGYPALEAEKARLMITEKLSIHFEPIVDKAIQQASQGNKDARDWLTDRAYGKPTQPITGKEGKDLFPTVELSMKSRQAILAFLNESNPENIK